MTIYTNKKQILSLPWVLVPGTIPETAGVYMIKDKSTDAVIYIGQTSNFQNRLFPSVHPVYDAHFHNLFILLFEDKQERLNFEENCILILKPERNYRIGWGVNLSDKEKDEAYFKIFG